MIITSWDTPFPIIQFRPKDKVRCKYNRQKIIRVVKNETTAYLSFLGSDGTKHLYGSYEKVEKNEKK